MEMPSASQPTATVPGAVSDQTGAGRIEDRITSICDYHRKTRYTFENVRAGPFRLDIASRPARYRAFAGAMKSPLPRKLLDEPAPTLSALASGTESILDSQFAPRQDMRTLATWLFMSNGLTEKNPGGEPDWWRSCPSNGLIYPFEIYVAAFSIEHLEPGLYHYCPKDFCLYRLRPARQTLMQLRRGAPELDFLKRVPAALLVSTVFSRAAWRYKDRGFRHALLDAGHLVQNIVTSAAGLGMQTLVRLTANESAMRDLLGLDPEHPEDEAEAVQAVVIWTDPADSPLELLPKDDVPPAGNGSNERLARPASAAIVAAQRPLVRIHEDCALPGSLADREIRPPLTELSPIPKSVALNAMPLEEPPQGGAPLRQVLMSCRSSRSFAPQAIAREQLLMINHLAFRGGTYFPLAPSGPYVGLVRPMWVVQQVAGLEPGIWSYDPPADRWALLRGGDFRERVQHMSLEQPMAADASAACFMFADLHALLAKAGPGAYRLAHLEAGIAAHRLCLASHGHGLGCAHLAEWYDEEIRRFFGMENTGWEMIYEVLIGVDGERGRLRQDEQDVWAEGWRD